MLRHIATPKYRSLAGEDAPNWGRCVNTAGQPARLGSIQTEAGVRNIQQIKSNLLMLRQTPKNKAL